MRDIHLVAYAEAGFDVVAIASRTPEHARAAAEQNGIGTVHDTVDELLADPRVEILDVAYPAHLQLDVVRAAVEHRDHIRGILAQKPLASTLADAIEIVRLCEDAGITLAVNQNMRYDQSMRALKALLSGGHLGTPIVGEIVMNARPHWQEFIRGYGRIAILNMSIHHLDAFRYLFGDPERILASVRPDPSWDFPHDDGMALLHPRVRGRPALRSASTTASRGPTTGSSGVSRARKGWRRGRSAGPTIRPEARARSTTTSARKRANGTVPGGTSGGSRRRSWARWRS